MAASAGSLLAPSRVLESASARIEFLGGVLRSMPAETFVTADFTPSSARVSAILEKSRSGVTFRLRIPRNSSFIGFGHPLEEMCPVRFGGTRFVNTLFWPGVEVDYIHPGLQGPLWEDLADPVERQLLSYLGRIVSDTDGRDCMSARFVEPGIGRTFLIDFLFLAGRADLHDFSATGVGLTPYAQKDFVLRGDDIDGRCSLIKARHRREIAESLENLGCRVPATCAILRLKGLEKRLPGGQSGDAAIFVRGARTILRVQQLDPLHGFSHSRHYRTLMANWYRSKLRNFKPEARDRAAIQFSKHLDQREIVNTASYRMLPAQNLIRLACEARLSETLEHAPVMASLSRRRLAMERGQDPDSYQISDAEYVRWFAESIGAQMAVMCRHRFLFDYRVARVPRPPNALHESQVSLLAEFHDLDTGIFTDNPLDKGVFLTEGELESLRLNYSEFHFRELMEAVGIVRTLALILSRLDFSVSARAVEDCLTAYRDGVAAK